MPASFSEHLKIQLDQRHKNNLYRTRKLLQSALEKLMKLNISYSVQAEKMAIQFADAAEMKPPCSAELIFGRFSDEDTNYYNLAFPADYQLDNELPHFFIGTIRVIVSDRKMAEHIDNKQLDFVECNFVFQKIS